MFTHLQRYTRPRDFADFGEVNRADYYTAYGQHRDADTLTLSNFRSMLARLGGESDTVFVIRDHHWAVGWVEAIYIHESDTARLAIAESILAALEDYPVVNEDDWSTLEYDRAATYWAAMSVADRVDWLHRHDREVSVFAARSADLPSDLQSIAELAA